MPRYGTGTFLNEKENEKVEKACKIRGCSKYKLLREGVLMLSDLIIEEEREKENVGEKVRGESSGKTESDSGANKTVERQRIF